MSNTATAALMCPLARAVVSDLRLSSRQFSSDRDYSVTMKMNYLAAAIDLGVAFGALLGGIATLTGTGTNIALEGTLSSLFGEEGHVSYLEWFIIAAPLSFVSLLILWIILSICFIYPCYNTSSHFSIVSDGRDYSLTNTTDHIELESLNSRDDTFSQLSDHKNNISLDNLDQNVRNTFSPESDIQDNTVLPLHLAELPEFSISDFLVVFLFKCVNSFVYANIS
jgi:hypothetical protein